LLAREGNVSHNGVVVFDTPLLIPSFSSKGFPEMKKIIRMMAEFITGSCLVSAYDIHYKLLAPKQLTFPEVVFLDSGGYEARVEHDLSEAYGQDYKPKKWTSKEHHRVLLDWKSKRPTIAISYDSPRRHSSIERQLAAAQEMKQKFPNLLHEFLIKPEHKSEFVDPDRVATIVSRLTEFSIIGFTEHELDNRVIGRMEKIAAVRQMFDHAGLTTPIHVFGSLDSLSTVLYFVSGAEIFDGLTWLRFGYRNGQTVYRQNYGAVSGENGILKSARELSHAMWKDNYYYLEHLRDQMRNFVRTQDFGSFEHIADSVQAAVHQLQSRVPR
jgi:hypothetical protein